MQITATMEHHYTPTSRAKTYKQTKNWLISSAEKQAKKPELSYLAGEWYSHSGKQNCHSGNVFFFLGLSGLIRESQDYRGLRS